MNAAIERLRNVGSPVVEAVVDFVVAMRRRDVLLASSSLAFYALVSAVPLVIVIFWLGSLAIGDARINQLANAIKAIAPDDVGADQAVQRVAELGTRVGVAALLGALWPATSYGAGLARALQRLSGEEGAALRGFRGRWLVLIGLFPILAFGGLLATVVAANLLGDGGGLARAMALVLGLAAGFVGSAAVAAVAYRLFPEDPPAWPDTFRGAAATGAAVALLSFGYLLYLRFGANFQDHYATSSVAGIVLLAVYLYLFNSVLLVGYAVARGVWHEGR